MTSTTAADLKEESRALIASDLAPPQLREALQHLHENWLAGLAVSLGVTPGSGLALLAVGSLGRGEFLPYSDLDLVLVHDNRPEAEVRAVAEGLWYPIWDANISLDHAVRTDAEMLSVVESDIRAALALLRKRLIAGDEDLSRRAAELALRSWRRRARERLPELLESARGRWARFGSVAHRAEPDLKSGKGGARDAQLLDALALAQLTDGVPALSSGAGGLPLAYAQLLDIRTQLRRTTGRHRDQLLAQDADEVAATLGGVIGIQGDRFDLARALSGIGRTMGYCVEVGLRVAQNSAAGHSSAPRRPLVEGVVAHGGEVVLANQARPDKDPGLVLRVAAASAVSGLPISQATLGRLAVTPLAPVWTRAMRQNLLTVLGAGGRTVAVLEALDRTGLWERLFPEWAAVRDLPPRDPIHVWTVDRHLVETVLRASALTTRVARPDLLLIGALVHDLGKGRGEDHSVAGERLAREIGVRLGLPAEDVDTLAALVRQHLLLPSMATRRDVRDPETIGAVLKELRGDTVLLELLEALAEADSLATGPGVWGEWKARLIAELAAGCRRAATAEMRRVAVAVAGSSAACLSERVGPLLVSARAAPEGPGQVLVEWSQPEEGNQFKELLLVAPDGPGLLAQITAVFALHGLRCHHAELAEADRFAVATFVASPRFGPPPSAQIIRQDLLRALAGNLDVLAVLAVKEQNEREALRSLVREVAVPAAPQAAEPKVLWLDGQQADPGQALVEVRGADRLGLLARLSAVFGDAGVSVLEARVETLGLSVVDVFVLPAPQLSPELRSLLSARLKEVLSAP